MATGPNGRGRNNKLIDARKRLTSVSGDPMTPKDVAEVGSDIPEAAPGTVLYIVACGGRPARDLPAFVGQCHTLGWQTCVIATPSATDSWPREE